MDGKPRCLASSGMDDLWRYLHVQSSLWLMALHILIVHGITLGIPVSDMTGKRSICYAHLSTGVVDIYMQYFISSPHS